MDGQDIFVSLGSVPDPLDRRPHYRIPGEKDLSRFLADARSTSITVRAEWSRLTTGVLCQLAEWAADHPGRGTGVLPVDSPGVSLPEDVHTNPIAVIVDPDGCGTLTESGRSGASLSTCMEVLARPERVAALAVTGHGGEHGVLMGDRWLSPFPQPSIPGRLVSPDAIHSRAVFLNTCGSLRLGDSVVPRPYSLASFLHGRGAAVIGAYCNQFTFPEASTIFAECVLAGLPMGRVPAILNQMSRERGVPTLSYQLLGDAAQVISSAPRGVVSRSPVVPTGGKVPRALIEDLSWLARLDTTIDGWMDRQPESVASHQELVRTLRTAFAAVHACTRGLLADSDADLLEVAARAAAQRHAARVLEELSQGTRRGIWLQQLYAPVSKAPEFQVSRCHRCDGRAMRHDFPALREGLLSVHSEECDRCGTVADTIGAAAPERLPLQIEVRDGSVEARVTALGPRCVGNIALSRVTQMAPRSWPAEGGVVRFPVSELPFRGKLTIVASQVGPGYLTFRYATLFVAPSL